MTIKIQKKIKFKNSCNCIVDYEELEKAIAWYSDNPVVWEDSDLLNDN